MVGAVRLVRYLPTMPNPITIPAGFRPPGNHRLPDAADEARRLQRLLIAHGPISADILGEALFAAAFGGEPMARGNKDYDVRCPRFGLVEVRSRILGTDGWHPRISLRRAPNGEYDHVAALRFEQDYSFWRAVVLPTAALQRLYASRRQFSGIAHIPWSAAADDPDTIDVTAEMRAVLGTWGSR